MWEYVKTGIEGNCELFGVNIFDYTWKNTNQKINVLDPSYGEPHEMDIYIVKLENKTVTFAAGEFSNGIYGFYVMGKYKHKAFGQ